MTHTVRLAGEDIEFPCDESQTVLDAALERGIALPYGCRNGLCGSCKATVLAGEVDYPDGVPGGLSEEDQQNHAALLCRAHPKSDLELEVQLVNDAPPVEVKTLPVKVKKIDHLSHDVVRLMLQLPSAESFDYRAGQWIYFLLKDGRKRAFSIANAPNDRHELELQIRHVEGGLFTDFVFNHLQEGAMLRIEGPHGSFYFHNDDRPLVLVAGGTGFAPLKGILEEFIVEGDYPHPIHLFWGARHQKDLYQDELVRQWIDEGLLQLDYTPVLSEPSEEDRWNGETGFVHEAVLRHYPDLSGHAVYMAGPPAMIESCRDGFIAAGLDEAHLHYDSFEYSDDARKAMQSPDAD